jgi:hypothetical protein
MKKVSTIKILDLNEPHNFDIKCVFIQYHMKELTKKFVRMVTFKFRKGMRVLYCPLISADLCQQLLVKELIVGSVMTVLTFTISPYHKPPVIFIFTTCFNGHLLTSRL